MKTLRKLFLSSIICSLILIGGCYQSGGEKMNLNQSVTDGYRLIDYANRLSTLKNYRNAVNNYLLAYNRFALADYIDGRLDAATKLVLVYKYIGLKDSSDYWLKKSEEISEYSINLKEKYLLIKVKYLYEENAYTEVLRYLSKIDIDKFIVGIKVEILSYKILAATISSVDAIDSYNSLHSTLTSLTKKDQISYEVVSFGWYTLGYSDFYKKDITNANIKFNMSLSIDKEKGNSEGIADNLFMLGKCAEFDGNKNEALIYYERALEIYKVLNSTELVSELINKISLLRKS